MHFKYIQNIFIAFFITLKLITAKRLTVEQLNITVTDLNHFNDGHCVSEDGAPPQPGTGHDGPQPILSIPQPQ